MITTIENLSNQFLIALPVIEDSVFDRSVSLICRHDKKGAMGVVFNKQTKYQLKDILTNIGIEVEDSSCADLPVYEGGPVHHERGFILHSPLGNWDSTLKVTANIGITSSKDILEAIAKGKGPTQFLVALGCAGWSEGQLEQELLDNAWITAPVDMDTLFAKDASLKWQASAKNIGVDILKISQVAGHA